MSYFVYILSNRRRTVFYTGVTNNLKRRVIEHKSKIGGGFTRKYNCDELVYFEEFSMIVEAIAREKKNAEKFRRDWKFQLIAKLNPNWVDLSGEW